MHPNVVSSCQLQDAAAVCAPKSVDVASYYFHERGNSRMRTNDKCHAMEAVLAILQEQWSVVMVDLAYSNFNLQKT